MNGSHEKLSLDFGIHGILDKQNGRAKLYPYNPNPSGLEQLPKPLPNIFDQNPYTLAI